MKKLTTLFLAVALVTPVFSQSPQIDALFPATPKDYVTDQANILSNNQFVEIRILAQRLKETTKVELAVVTLPTLNDRAPVEVATAIGRKWGVGSVGAVGSEQRNAGLVLLIVPRHGEVKGKCFLAVGNGMEGRITDLIASRICTETIAPIIRASGMNYGAGITAGIERIQQLASSTALKTVDPATTVTDKITISHSGWWFLGTILALVVIIWGALRAFRFKNEPEFSYVPPKPDSGRQDHDQESGMGLAAAAIIASSVTTPKPKHKADEDTTSSSSDYSSSSHSSSSYDSGSGSSDFGGFGGGGGFSGGGGGGDI